MDDMMIFAERLTAEMERQELTYRQLAEKMGITVTTLFRYAKGQRVPKATEIVKASRALGVTCDYLIGLSDDPHKTSAESVYHPVSVNTDLISRRAVMRALEKCHKQCCREDDGGDEWIHYETTVNELECIPSAQPERKMGHWICESQWSDTMGTNWNTWKCDQCNVVAAKGWEHTRDGSKPNGKFCSECGAPMDKNVIFITITEKE